MRPGFAQVLRREPVAERRGTSSATVTLEIRAAGRVPGGLRFDMRVGVDSGGTFTDFIAWDGRGLRSAKIRSTPDDPARAILEGVRSFPASEVVHGSTVATNALLQRIGARTALVTTRGFEDILELARQNRARLYDWTPAPRQGLLADGLRFGVAERTLHDGSVLEPLLDSEVANLAARVGDAEAVAVCLLHSYTNAEHERRIGEALREAGYAVSLSSELLPEYREYERAATTVVNAYVSPLMQGYIRSLRSNLPGVGLRVFQSNGGSISADEASDEAVRTVLSGPAGGLVGAAAIAEQLGIDRFITFDMGGTSTDVSLYDGEPAYTTEGAAGGLPVRVPMLDIESIGAGGGSIAYFDEGSALRVGPRSAGAVPGPICYGSGTEVTVTDANLLLGRIETGSFLEGTIQLDVDRTREYAEMAATEAGVSVEDLALAIIRAVNAKMERAVRSVSMERGHDPRGYAMICFGGAGPLHACQLAENLGIGRVVVPAHAGVLSALGMLVADCVRDYSRSVLNQDPAAAFADLEATALKEMRDQGYADMTIIRSLDMRYVGQSYELNVPESRSDEFDSAHERRYGYCHSGRATEAVTARVKVIGKTPRSERPDLTSPSAQPRFASIHVPNGWKVQPAAGDNTILERVS